MTRINLIDPSYLINEHLMAEYREMPRIFRAVIEANEAGKTASDFRIPKQYVLGTGHMTFFYDKCGWLSQRWETIRDELYYGRKFALDPAYIELVMYRISILPKWSLNNYHPTPGEIYWNMERITDRWVGRGRPER